jgi:hypothetical protein
LAGIEKEIVEFSSPQGAMSMDMILGNTFYKKLSSGSVILNNFVLSANLFTTTLFTHHHHHHHHAQKPTSYQTSPQDHPISISAQSQLIKP